MKSPRFWVVLLILLAAFTTLHLRASVDRVPPSESLSLLPQTMDRWTSQDIPITQETLAEMIGTTRSRVSFFMNRFRKLGFISYKGRIQVHKSLLNVVLLGRLPEHNAEKPPVVFITRG